MKKFLLCLTFMMLGFGVYAEDGKALAEKITKDAVAFAKDKGKDAVIAEVNKGTFRKGEIYVTLYDMEGKCLAHPTKPAKVGNNMMNDKDVDGIFFIKDRLKIAKEKGSGWHTYKYQNPESKKIEPKENYVDTFDGIVFSAGYYKK